MTDDTALSEALSTIARMGQRIAELEAIIAMQSGTLAAPTPDRPATYTHDVPPNAPR